jgi:hypothetical protein
MKHFAYIFFILVLFNSCKKEEKVHKVIYKVTVSGGSPSYTVQYSDTKNSSKSGGPFTASWLSPTIKGFEAGNTVSFSLNARGTGATYNMYIYVDGYLEKEGASSDPSGQNTISVVIPD